MKTYLIFLRKIIKAVVIFLLLRIKKDYKYNFSISILSRSKLRGEGQRIQKRGTVGRDLKPQAES